MFLLSSGNATTVAFLDDIKDLGYNMAYRGGLSFNLDDVIIPDDQRINCCRWLCRS